MEQSKHQFLGETEDLIEQIFLDLEDLREQAGKYGPQPELVDRLFRRIHRVKGSAASFGFDGLSETAHEFENLLSAVRTGRAFLDAEVLDTCESAASALAESLQLASSGMSEPSRGALFDRIESLARGVTGAPAKNIDAILSEIQPELRQSLTDDEKRRLVQLVEKAAPLYVVTVSFNVADFDVQFRKLKKNLEELGEVIATSPTVNAERAGEVDFRVLFTSKANSRDVSAKLADFAGVRLGNLKSDISRQYPQPEVQAAGLRLRFPSPLTNVIRIDADELDSLLSSTHDLFRTTTRAIDLALSQREVGSQVREELKQLEGQIRRSFLSVEKNLIDLRMVSPGPMLRRAARAGRVAARSSNKKVDFRIVGEDLRLDRLLCDAIADPLIHLVRNAVDHGIEPPDLAVAPEEGKRPLVRIEALRQGKRTWFRVADNGRGVDPELVAQAAVRLGIIDEGTLVDMERSLRLIFRPGFTTVASVSSVSGRGFGLDIVETAVEQVGGELHVSSEPGKGSTFEIRLPVTVGLLNSAIVLSGGCCYCIDAGQIVKAEPIDASEIEKRGPGETVKIGDPVLPLVHLSVLLGQSLSGPVLTGAQAVVVCEFTKGSVGGGSDRNEQIGIIVDAIRGTEEVLVRNLGRHAARWRGVAGAAELHDGTVALVLDLPRLLSGTDFSL